MTAAAPRPMNVSDDELIRSIEGTLAEDARPASLVTLRRRPWEYTTSCAIELVTAVLDDGSSQDFVLKHLGWRGASDRARRAKPAFVLDPQREVEVYRNLLSPLHVGPRLIGWTVSPETDTYWLLLERVTGRPLYEAGGLERWAAVAAWLRALHNRLAEFDVDRLRSQVPLITYDYEWYTQWMNRALRFFADADPVDSRRSRSALQWLAGRYDRIVERLLSLPRGIIHGEFYPSNVLVTETADDLSVWPIDWEMTSIGPGIIDLAALTAGGWRDDERYALVAAYVDGSGPGAADVNQVAESVMYAQVHLAVQWLGWFGRRQPTPAHARDWLS